MSFKNIVDELGFCHLVFLYLLLEVTQKLIDWLFKGFINRFKNKVDILERNESLLIMI